MQSTFRLIKLGSASSKRSPNSLTALHLLAAVDPRCSWFSKWTLSNVGKTQTVAAIQKLDLMPDLVGYIMDFLLQISLGVLDRRGYSDVIVEDYEEMNDPDHIEHHHHDADNMIASHVLNYIHFIHAVTIMAKLVQFSAGRLCFPVKLTNERHKASLNRLLECERKGKCVRDDLTLIIPIYAH